MQNVHANRKKKKYLLLIIFIVIAIALLFPNIHKIIERHHRVQNLAIFQKIGMKINEWNLYKGESFHDLTNTEFLATLAPEEAAFIKANIIIFPTNEVFMQTETACGKLILYRNGVGAVK